MEVLLLILIWIALSLPASVLIGRIIEVDRSARWPDDA